MIRCQSMGIWMRSSVAFPSWSRALDSVCARRMATSSSSLARWVAKLITVGSMLVRMTQRSMMSASGTLATAEPSTSSRRIASRIGCTLNFKRRLSGSKRKGSPGSNWRCSMALRNPITATSTRLDESLPAGRLVVTNDIQDRAILDVIRGVCSSG